MRAFVRNGRARPLHDRQTETLPDGMARIFFARNSDLDALIKDRVMSRAPSRPNRIFAWRNSKMITRPDARHEFRLGAGLALAAFVIVASIARADGPLYRNSVVATDFDFITASDPSA